TQVCQTMAYAHSRGVLHRDLKPANIMVGAFGEVQVMDWGLARALPLAGVEGVTPVEGLRDATEQGRGMGTYAYMPPEQAQDAAHVDQRADVYSLGCTLYHLVTGRPPYSGRTAMEVITKHQREPLTPPDAVVDDVPRSLSSIIQKMLAKKPEQRMQTMREVIVSLEDFLGIATAGPFTPKEEHVRTMEFASRSFAESTWANLRPKLFIAFFVLCGFGAVIPWFMDASETFKLGVSGAVVGFAVLTTLAYQITLGLFDRTPIFDRIRQYVFGAGLLDWLIWLIGGATIVLVLNAFGLLWWWIGAGIVAIGVAQAFYWVVDRQAKSDRRSAVVQADHLLKQMRERGLEENTLRQFVAKHGGEMWEAFFEAMFGYDAKIAARRAGWGKERGRERSRWGAWREPIIDWFDEKIRLRRERREAKMLARAEAKALQSKGIHEQLAMKQAMKNAERYVQRAGKLRRTSERKLYAAPLPAAAPPGRDAGKGPDKPAETAAPGKPDADATLVKSAPPGKTILDEEDDEHEPRKRESYFRRRYGGPLDMLLGAQVRFFLATIILACFAVWFQQNRGQQALEETVDTVNARRVIEGGTDVRGTIERAGDVGQEAIESMRERVGSQPLRLPLVPERFSKPLGGWHAGLAGMLMLLSCFFSGKTLAVFVLLSAGTALYAHQPWFPVVGQMLHDGKPGIAAAAAVGLWLFGVIFFRVNDD
ncbi:MAG TPA: serine/threonine-protein kinase, partial [Tepidisphaeraceae bacterium]|nr:serine/threonine-protein kinase [Tepidisphaeraceae bacterium]